MLAIVPVVEGPGDVAAVPMLLRRVLYERYQRYDIGVAKPVPSNGRSKLLAGFENFLNYATLDPACGAILALLDADDDCPIQLAQGLTARVNQAGVFKPTAIVCARREYETWFLASLETLKGNSGIANTASFTGDIEEVRDPKGWLTRQMPQGRAYKETSDQASMTQRVDLEMARGNSRSFRRLCHAVEQLLSLE